MPEKFEVPGIPDKYKEPEKDPEREALQILTNLDLRWKDLEDKKILDVGAGSGFLGQQSKKHGASVISMDVTKITVKKAKEKYNVENYIVANAGRPLPFKDEQFDFALDSGGPSIEKSPQTLKEFLRILKHGGEIRHAPALTGLDMIYVAKTKELGRPLEEEEEQYLFDQYMDPEFVRPDFPFEDWQRVFDDKINSLSVHLQGEAEVSGRILPAKVRLPSKYKFKGRDKPFALVIIKKI